MHTTHNAAALALLHTLQPGTAYNASNVLALLAAKGHTINRPLAGAVLHVVRRKAFNLRRVRRAAKAHYLGIAIAKVTAHSVAQFAKAQRYGVGW